MAESGTLSAADQRDHGQRGSSVAERLDTDDPGSIPGRALLMTDITGKVMIMGKPTERSRRFKAAMNAAGQPDVSGEQDGPITRMARTLRRVDPVSTFRPAAMATTLFNNIIDVVAVAGETVTVEVPGQGVVMTYRGRLAIEPHDCGDGTLVRRVVLVDLEFHSARSAD